jgi:hypothetical protein
MFNSITFRTSDIQAWNLNSLEVPASGKIRDSMKTHNIVNFTEDTGKVRKF